MHRDFADYADRDDRTAKFLQLLNQHERALNAYIFTLRPHWADAEDIAQEMRLRLWKQFDKYEPGTDFCAWARSIAYYLVLNYRAKQTRDRLRFGLPYYQSIAEAVSAKPDLVVARQKALTRCMEKLDASKRALIENYYCDDCSLRELAKQQGRSYDAVRKTVYRTQIMLADCIRTELQKKETNE